MVHITDTSGGTVPVRFQVIDCLEEWEQAKPEWNALVAGSSVPSFFLTYGYLRSAWESYGRGASLHIVRIYAGDTLLGMVPLKIVLRRVCGIPARTLQPIGGEEAEGNFFIVLKKYDLFYRAFTRYLTDNSHLWCKVYFHLLDCSHPFLPYFHATFSRDRSLIVERSEGKVHPFVTIGNSWERYVESLNRKFITNLRYRIRRALKEGELRVVRFSSPEDVGDNLETYVKLEDRSWKTAGDSGITRTPELYGLYHGIFDRCAEEGFVELTFLVLNDRVLAGTIGVIFAGRHTYLQTVYDASAAHLSPGIILMAITVWRAFMKKLTIVDFMGDYVGYKKECARCEWQSCTIDVRKRFSGEGLAYYGSRWIRPALDALLVRSRSVRPEQCAETAIPPVVMDPTALDEKRIILGRDDIEEIFMLQGSREAGSHGK